MIVIRIVLFVAFLLFALLFAYYNLESVKLSFLNYTYELPLFLLVFVSFIAGFLIAFFLGEIRGLGLRRYAERVRRGLAYLWRGYPSRAETELSKILNREEVFPLFLKALKGQGRRPSGDLQRYSGGIAETALAEEIFREDRDRAKDLLEKALGKEWGNLRARRLLRGLFFLEGEGEKALELQRSLASDCERSLRDEERKVLASVLAEVEGESALSELEKLPPTPVSLALLSSVPDQKRRRKNFSRSFGEGVHNEVLMILVERNALTPEVIELVEDNRDRFNPQVLALLYMDVGMYEKLEGLKAQLPEPIKLVVDLGTEGGTACQKSVRSLLRIWECLSCGREHRSYTPVCPGCLEWNKLRVKGGS